MDDLVQNVSGTLFETKYLQEKIAFWKGDTEERESVSELRWRNGKYEGIFVRSIGDEIYKEDCEDGE